MTVREGFTDNEIEKIILEGMESCLAGMIMDEIVRTSR